MLVTGNVPIRNYQDVASQKISTLASREVSGYSSGIWAKKKQKAKLKFKKIKFLDKIIAPIGMPQEYCCDDEYIINQSFWANIRHTFEVSKHKTSSGNFFVSGMLDDSPSVSTKYFRTTYLITEIESPVPREGAGTEALQGLVEKSMLDDETQGRVILYQEQCSPEDTSAVFFYKLGFRCAESDSNEILDTVLDKNLTSFELPSGYMYLPKDNIQKLLRYGHLF